MRIALDLPDDMAASLAPSGRDSARVALEALAIEAFRGRRITGFQLRNLLGIPSRLELDGFLKSHQVEKYTAEDFDGDLAAMDDLGKIGTVKRCA
jgi:Uncharacterised protein family (UPF0175)